MKILHIGDTHLGFRQYRSETRYEDFFDALEESIQYAKTNNVDAIIQTGDLFDSSDPSIETLNRCLSILSQLDGIPFYAIVGNHERKRNTQWIEIIDRLSGVHHLSRDPTTISGRDGVEVDLYGIDAVRKPQWNATDFELQASEEDNSNPRILCMHELCSPPIQSNPDSTSNHMETYDMYEIVDRCKLSVDVIALGDYHYPASEELTSGEVVYYAGATERTKRNQSRTTIVELEFDQQGLQNKQVIDITTSRPFVEVNITLEKGMTQNDIRTQISEYDFKQVGSKNSIAVVTLEGEDIGIPTTKIKKMVFNDGAEVVKIVDNRSSSVNIEEISSLEKNQSYTEQIDELVMEKDFSEETFQIDEIVRGTEIKDSNVRDEVHKLLTENNTETDEIETKNAKLGDL